MKLWFFYTERLEECIWWSYFSRIGTTWTSEEEEVYTSVRWQGIAIGGTHAWFQNDIVVPGDDHVVYSVLNRTKTLPLYTSS